MTKPNRDAAFGRLAIDRLCKSAASCSRATLRQRPPGVALADAAAYGVGTDRSRFTTASRAPSLALAVGLSARPTPDRASASPGPSLSANRFGPQLDKRLRHRSTTSRVGRRLRTSGHTFSASPAALVKCDRFGWSKSEK